MSTTRTTRIAAALGVTVGALLIGPGIASATADEPPTEPAAVTAPASRGEAVELPAPDLGRCIDGITEFGFVACEPVVVATGLPPIPPAAPAAPAPTAAAPAPVVELPATGIDTTVMAIVALVAILAGVPMAMATRGGPSTRAIRRALRAGAAEQAEYLAG